MKLYSVMTNAEDFHGHQDVIIEWFRVPSETGGPYLRFTLEEAEQLKAYLDKKGGPGTTSIVQADAPEEGPTFREEWQVRVQTLEDDRLLFKVIASYKRDKRDHSNNEDEVGIH